MVSAVKPELFTILNEVIKNACEANQETGQREIIVSCDSDGNKVKVEDFGKPLNTKNIADLVFLFGTTKFDIPGRGVGLYLVNNFCLRNDWPYEFIAKKQGTVFELDLSSSVLRKKKKVSKKKS